MDDTAAEIRALRQSLGSMKALLLLQCFFFVGMSWGIHTAGSAAGPRLVRLREENDTLHKENVELREALSKVGASAPKTP